jgi:hypothetical protein
MITAVDRVSITAIRCTKKETNVIVLQITPVIFLVVGCLFVVDWFSTFYFQAYHHLFGRFTTSFELSSDGR